MRTTLTLADDLAGLLKRRAGELDPARFRNVGDIGLAFEDFCGLCNIAGIPLFQPSLL